MKPLKVTKIEQSGDHITCEGKLVLTHSGEEPKNGVIGLSNTGMFISVGDSDGRDCKSVKPIIISAHEQHPNNLGYYNGRTNTVVNSSPTWLPNKFCKVILALPENFSPELLHDIVNGKLKDGDEVLIECEFHSQEVHGGTTLAINYQIKFNSSNHIALLPIKGRGEVGELPTDTDMQSEIDVNEARRTFTGTPCIAQERLAFDSGFRNCYKWLKRKAIIVIAQLKESLAKKDEEIIDFAEWIRKEAFVSSYGKWIQYWKNDDSYTTSELFSKYKEAKSITK